jgi:hypothetical protein
VLHGAWKLRPGCHLWKLGLLAALLFEAVLMQSLLQVQALQVLHVLRMQLLRLLWLLLLILLVCRCRLDQHILVGLRWLH